MRSLIAALRSLVLPNGATSGRRIVLDADQGVILVYDVNNNLIGSIAPSDNPGQWVAGIANYTYMDGGGNNHSVQMDLGSIIINTFGSGAQNFVATGGMSLDDSGATNPVGLRITAPTYDTNGHTATVQLLSAPGPGGNGARPIVTVTDGVSSGPGLCDGQISGNWHATDPTDALHQSQETWHTFAPLAGGWTQDTNADTFAYLKDASGFVHFRGALLAGTKTDGTTVATVPAQWRPPTKDVLTLVTHSSLAGASRCQISASTGAIQVFDVSTAAGLHFDQVSYYVG